jgi:bifunctional pyridoxal-dependent enzyme with beta-cystathionase and maltose regulon repressor activities
MDASHFPVTMVDQPKEGSMTLQMLAIDLGKQSFHLHGIDAGGVIVSRKVSRAKLAEAVNSLGPATIAMEACASAHYWGRRWLAAGCAVRLINPRFVKPFVKGSKKRCGRCGGDLRSGDASDDAFRAGEVGGSARPSIPPSCP